MAKKISVWRGMSLTLEARRLTAEHRCYLCRRLVLEGTGVYYADLGILSHEVVCSPIVDGERRVYDQSPRGRWRPRRDVLARVRSYWPVSAPADNLLRELDVLEGRT